MQGEQNQIVRMDDSNIGVEQKELLQALHAATDKLEKQYTLLQLERQRAKGLEEKLKEEHEKAQQIQRLIGSSAK
jgi:transcriptional antiterminator